LADRELVRAYVEKSEAAALVRLIQDVFTDGLRGIQALGEEVVNNINTAISAAIVNMMMDIFEELYTDEEMTQVLSLLDDPRYKLTAEKTPVAMREVRERLPKLMSELSPVVTRIVAEGTHLPKETKEALVQMAGVAADDLKQVGEKRLEAGADKPASPLEVDEEDED
jgi:hypothetical protein